jgi:zinc protease
MSAAPPSNTGAAARPSAHAARHAARDDAGAAAGSGIAAGASGTSAPPRLVVPAVRHELSCGARLVVSPRRHSPVCAIAVSIDAGHWLDPVGLDGLAAFAGSLAVEGTARYSESRIADLLEPHGGSIVGDAGSVTASIAGPNWRTLVAVVGEVLMAPTYPLDRVERQREILLDRLRIDEDEPRVQVARLFNELVYGTDGLGRPRRGTVETIGRITRDDLLAFTHEHVVAGRAIIGVCGDVDPDLVRAEFEHALAQWPRGHPAPPIPSQFPPLATRIAAWPAERQQVQLVAGHLGITRLDPRYAAAVVMDHVLGTGPGFTDRISKRLRDDEGLAYSVSANLASSSGRAPGAFQAVIATSKEKVRAALRGFVEEIERIRRERVSADELHLVRQYLSGSFVLGFEKATRRAAHVVNAERFGLPDGHLDRFLEDLVTVDEDAVLACARELLHPEHLVVAAAGPLTESELRAALDAAR